MNMKKLILLGVLIIIVIQVFSICYNPTMDKPIQLREFNSLNELQLWLSDNNINNNTYIENTYDCDNFAIDLVNDAIQDGYFVYSMGSGTVWGYNRIMYNMGNDTFYWGIELVDFVNHAYCITKINDIWYMIEPQNDVVTELGEEI